MCNNPAVVWRPLTKELQRISAYASYFYKLWSHRSTFCRWRVGLSSFKFSGGLRKTRLFSQRYISAVQGHPRSLILIPMQPWNYFRIIPTYVNVTDRRTEGRHIMAQPRSALHRAVKIDTELDAVWCESSHLELTPAAVESIELSSVVTRLCWRRHPTWRTQVQRTGPCCVLPLFSFSFILARTACATDVNLGSGH